MLFEAVSTEAAFLLHFRQKGKHFISSAAIFYLNNKLSLFYLGLKCKIQGFFFFFIQEKGYVPYF